METDQGQVTGPHWGQGPGAPLSRVGGIGLVSVLAPLASATLRFTLTQGPHSLQLDSREIPILLTTGSPISSYQRLSLEASRAQLSLPSWYRGTYRGGSFFLPLHFPHLLSNRNPSFVPFSSASPSNPQGLSRHAAA